MLKWPQERMNQSSAYSAISGMRKFWLKQIFLVYSVLIVFRSTDYDVVYRLVVVYVLRLLMIIPIL